MSAQDKHVVFYDGVCRLCDRTVRLLLAIDRDRILWFAPLQGEAAEGLKQGHPEFRDLKTMLFVENYGTAEERVSSRSTGILRMLLKIGGFWRVVSWLRLIPAPLRDLGYRAVARYRYRWFGRLETCRLPGENQRFLN